MDIGTGVLKKALKDFINDLRLFKQILGWHETWIPTLVVLGWMSFMIVYAYAHYLANPWRSIVIWGIILSLAIIAPGVVFFSRKE
ncbi:MAG: hypothetical protein PVH12_05430 [Candidatus Bathyarchaeota archaeon]|jgi:hypothetical protein